VSVALAAGLGLGLGVVTGMPLGVINVAIVDAAAAKHARYAAGLGLGGGAADSVHATLAFAGVGRILTSHPEWIRGLAIAAAVAIVGYAIVAWRRHLEARDGKASSPGGLGRGVATGAALTLPNPGALGAWVAVAAAVWPAATITEAIVIGGCVGIGSALWFTLLARGVSRLRSDHAALRWIPRLALVLLVALAITGVVRAL
jgi:threonine/homoserine/homoserine lactone efflux protein